MRFLLDQDVFAVTLHFLIELGHDVIPVVQLGLSRANDEGLLKVAQEQNRIFVTRDRDFGNLVFVKALGAGILYLRMLPSTQKSVHAELEKVLNTYTEDELMQAFVVIEPDGHRFRRLPR
jgi:predicted nuclease of predicted toxin-antitoxin system